MNAFPHLSRLKIPPRSFHPKVADPNVEEGTVKRVDVHYKCKINLPANAPLGNPHIIIWNAAKRDKVPYDLSTVDVIATILFELNPSALAHLLDTQIEQFYCWWKADGQIEDSEDTTDDESDESDPGLPYFVHIHRFRQFVRVWIAGQEDRCLSIEVSYCIRDEGKWEIVSSQHRRSDRDFYLNKNYPDACKAHDHQLASAIISKTDLENKSDMFLGYHLNYKLQNGLGALKYPRCKTQIIVSNTCLPNDSSRDGQDTACSSGRSSISLDHNDLAGTRETTDETAELQDQGSALRKSVKEVASSSKKRKCDD
ncbi:hypothetical protein EAF04_003062 [Stromatinia cepivora]|nr:hypothetical protein EAF04_003062 [Stromatinia cepivora]